MKKILIAGTIVIVLAGILILTLRFFSGEDNWICNSGEWVKHGNPDSPKPAAECKK
jgi:hypothetical protein